MASDSPLVLVTGGTGFVARHCINDLLSAGYRVRATVRAPEGAESVREFARLAGADAEVVVADLTADGPWADAVADCDYVLHVAAPFPAVNQMDQDLLTPSRDGALRVLDAASRNRVKRVVVTSSLSAIAHGHKNRREPFTESDWTDLDGPDVNDYIVAKTLAEKAVWDWARDTDSSTEVVVLNPGHVFGPVFDSRYSQAISVIGSLLDGVNGVPRTWFTPVDARDLAVANRLAMTVPEAAGHRFIAATEAIEYPAIAQLIRERLGEAGQHVTSRIIPSWQIRAMATISPAVRPLAAQVDKPIRVDTRSARELLGWQPRPVADTVEDTARSLITLNEASGD